MYKSESIDLDRLEIAASQNVKEKEYWLGKLSGTPVKSIFPYDHRKKEDERTDIDTKNDNVSRTGSLFSFEITGGLFTRLVNLSNQSDPRLHMILVAGITILLGKYSHPVNHDIIVGIPIYKEDTDREFINTVLAIRNRLEKDMTCKELLLQVRNTIQEAVLHQDYPIEILLKHLNMQITGNDFPLFDIVILCENIHQKKYIRRIHPGLLFSFLRTGERIQGIVQYNSLRYRESTIKRIITHLTRLLNLFLRDINIPVASLEILSEEEKQQLLYDFNETETPGKSPAYREKTIHQLFEEQVEQNPDHIAAAGRETGHKSRSITTAVSYRELNIRSNRLAGELRKIGVTPNCIVGLIIEPGLEMVIGILGILKAGGAYMPFDLQYPPDRILSILEDTQCSFLLVSQESRKKFAFTSLENIKKIHVSPILTRPREQIKNLNELPLPDRTLVDYKKYHPQIGIAMAKHSVSLQTSRGCPYNCAYCHKIWPKTHVVRSADNIFTEIHQLHTAGIKRFVFIDDIFNLKKKNAAALMEKIITHLPGLQLFFPNGLRGDILDKEFIDLMVEAGTVNIALALESPSPRIQALIQKHLHLDTFKENVFYITGKYPQIILEMELMTGFPTETEEEAVMLLDFIKQFKWLHFPNLHILKIYPHTDMYRLAKEHGIPVHLIEDSTSLAFHELPGTLPYPKQFAREFQTRFMNEYMLSKERLLSVLPYQANILSHDELVRKYDSYFPEKIETFSDILKMGGIAPEEFPDIPLNTDENYAAPQFNEKIKAFFPHTPKHNDVMKILLLDLSQLFSGNSQDMLYDMVEEPLGMIYLMTYLEKKFTGSISGQIARSGIDFDSFEELKNLIAGFKPHLIGIRSLSYFKEFFHRTVALIRSWGIDTPIVAGGPYVTSQYPQVLQDGNIDLAVLGEGELTLAHLVEKMIQNNKKLPRENQLLEIPGIALIKKENRTIIDKKRRKIITPDNLPPSLTVHPGENHKNLENVNKPEDLLYLISTSGSTGTPKSVMLEHRNLVNLMASQLESPQVHFNRVLQFASIGFDVSAQEIFSTLLSGGTLFLLNNELKHDIPGLFDYIERNVMDTLFLPPSFLRFVFSEPEYARGFPKCVKHIIAAGEQLIVPEPLQRFLKENRAVLHNHYGPTETHVVSTLTMDPAGEIPGMPSIGKPIANTRLYVLDEQQDLKAIGVPGELYISGANVGRGYYNREQPTTEKFLPDPFFTGQRMYRTGDLARWTGNGEIEFLGRIDHQVKLRGYRIEPGEIETQLTRHKNVKQALVAAHKGKHGSEYLCAYIVPDREREPDFNQFDSLAEELKKHLSRSMPDYMIPNYFIRIEGIPLTDNGKIDRKALPGPGNRHKKVNENAGGFNAPGDETEKKLAAIWAEVLEMESNTISIDGNFFGMGGHSLKATIMTSKIQREFSIKLPLGQMFNLPTIRKLAGYIKEAEKETTALADNQNQIVSLKKKSGTGQDSHQQSHQLPHQYNLFLVHDGTGELEGYLEFCRYITIDMNCWGIRAPRHNHFAPGNLSIEEISRHYIEEIKKIQPGGPYCLAGWSIGGTIAFEILRQLEKTNETVNFFAMIDSLPPRQNPHHKDKKIEFSIQSELEWLHPFLDDNKIREEVEKAASLDQLWHLILNYLEKINLDNNTLRNMIPAKMSQAIPDIDGLTGRQMIFHLNMIRTFTRARDNYIPRGKVKTPIHFFAASRENIEKAKGWQPFSHNLIDIHRIPGDHFSILKSPAVVSLSSIFSSLVKNQ